MHRELRRAWYVTMKAMRRRVWRSVSRWVSRGTSFVAVVLLAACVSTTFPDGSFACDPTAAPECPPGLVCAGDGRCRRSAGGGPSDGGPADVAPGSDTGAPSDGAADDGATSDVLVGDPQSGGAVDTVPHGYAAAFPFVAAKTGDVARLFVRLDATNTASQVQIGLYTEDFEHPSQLRTQGTIVAATAGWNSVAVTPAQVIAGTNYWIAVLSKTPGADITINEDAIASVVRGEYPTDTMLDNLPAPWPSGATFRTPPICAYGATR